MMWASMIVVSDSCIPSWVNSSSAETPATISGVTSGISISTFVTAGCSAVARADEPEREQRSRATVATTIVTSGDLEARRSATRAATVVEELAVPLEREARRSSAATCSELNENRTTIAIGANSQSEEQARSGHAGTAAGRRLGFPRRRRRGRDAGACRRRSRRASSAARPPSAGRRPSRSSRKAISTRRQRGAERPVVGARRTAAGSGSRPCRCRARRAAGR